MPKAKTVLAPKAKSNPGGRKPDPEFTLRQIAQHDGKTDKMMTFGVIVDSSEPTRDPNKGGYLTKLKIIDDTFNYKQVINNDSQKFHKFIHVHIRTKDYQNAPRVKNIGAIIRLRRFCFNLTSKGELMAFDSTISNWLIFSHELNSGYESPSFHYISKNFNRENTPFETERIASLRCWIDDYFNKNSLRNVVWWSPLREPISDKRAALDKVVENEVDLILKVQNVLKAKNALEFEDKMRNNYALFLQDTPLLNVDDVIKLRCVNVIFTPDGRILQLTKNSSCLVIPESFYDTKLLTDKCESLGGNEVHNNNASDPLKSPTKSCEKDKATTMASESQLNTQYQRDKILIDNAFLIDFEFDHKLKMTSENQIVSRAYETTIIKKKYLNKIPTPLKQMSKIMEDLETNVNQRYLISGYILGFNNVDPEKIFKKYCADCKKVLPLDSDLNSCCDEPQTIINHLIIHFKDKSIENVEKNFNLYLLTNDGEQNTFDLWGVMPRSKIAKTFKKTLNEDGNSEKFKEKLELMTSSNSKASFVVELMQSNSGKPYLKVFDTVFLP